ncbi:metalloregulator ArsR/SmtB family transcription factor [Aquabacterium sp. A7-Y]|uniref:ArsR/SmtB family transcription factor n=1 Tax=Aquabacterium sp. A7-Y TaxID=1349605 RepID=UPI00223DBB51|nr:metalloregulator ArsR/SmtB family transcription factor [Aquabacterium sp. A7-Y]MCW7540985.1 metalloregulator ArsR/SmtB family transcription factor [Aquabacterium sp. A7-Y]
MEEALVVRALAALAQPIRLRVFRTLVAAGGCGVVPSSLSECLGVPSPTLSFHLKELVHAQLVSQERCGRFLIYRASLEHMNCVVAYLTAHCCGGRPCTGGIREDCQEIEAAVAGDGPEDRRRRE